MKKFIKKVINKIKFKLNETYQRIRMSNLISKGASLNSNAKSILFWVPGGMSLMLDVEGALAVALRARGNKVHAVICDGTYKACILRTATEGTPVADWGKNCSSCKAINSNVLKKMNVPHSFIGDYISESTLTSLRKLANSVTWENIDNVGYKDILLGKNIRSALTKYLQGQNVTLQPDIIREYAFSALIVAAASENAINTISPSRIFMSHGIYVDWGPALQTAFKYHIPVSKWASGYLYARFLFRNVEDNSHVDHTYLSDAAWQVSKSSTLTPLATSRLDEYLNNRYLKKENFDLKVMPNFVGNADMFLKKYGFSSEKPVWGIITHVNWDAVCDASPMAYSSFDEWILDTTENIINIKNVQWLIKIHPAEQWSNDGCGVQDIIQNRFPNLPPHIKIIPPDDNISPLDFFQVIDGGVTVFGTSGLELTLMGKPVIVAGEAHYGQKGFTRDGLTPDVYRNILQSIENIGPLTNEQQMLAKKYAYNYFLQRQIPFKVVQDNTSSFWKFQFDKRDLLLPDKDPFVDFICDRIIDGKDFIMDEDLVVLAEQIA